MAGDGDQPDNATLSPDEAFGALGNETRVRTLQVLGEAESPLPFTVLRERVGVDDPGQFNYHLNQLKGHFVRKVENGYALRESGSRVVQAVLSGVVTGSEPLEPTAINAPCPYCGAEVEIQFAEERVLVRCTDCPGSYAGSETDARFLEAAPRGTIAFFLLPPAGIGDRTLDEVLETAMNWTVLEVIALANGFCPRCSTRVDQSLNACEAHETATEVCGRCLRRHAVCVDYACRNCTKVEERIPLGIHLLSHPELQTFARDHGIDPTRQAWEDGAVFVDYDEVVTTDPFRARLTFAVDDDELVLSVDESLAVVDTQP